MDVDDDLIGADEVDVELGKTVSPVEASQARFDHQGFAEDAGGFGERHGELALQRRPTGQGGVVVGVAEFVGGRLCRVGRPRPVEQHERPVADERRTEGATGFAVSGLGIDP